MPLVLLSITVLLLSLLNNGTRTTDLCNLDRNGTYKIGSVQVAEAYGESLVLDNGKCSIRVFGSTKAHRGDATLRVQGGQITLVRFRSHDRSGGGVLEDLAVSDDAAHGKVNGRWVRFNSRGIF